MTSMLTPEHIVTFWLNTGLVAMLALAYHEMIRPGKILGWWAEWLWKINGRIEVPTFRHRLFNVITYTLRGECFACLGGQLGLAYYLICVNVPTSPSELVHMVLFLAPCILFTYPLNKLFQWQ